MSAALVIAKRDFAAFFRLPIGWLVVALYSALAGAVFSFGALTPGAVASMRDFFDLATWLTLFVAPAASMRLIAEEFRTGTIEPLSAAPAPETQIALGKFLAGFAFLTAMQLPTLAFPITLAALAPIDVGPIVAGYVGLALFGAVCLAVGLFFSSLTSSQAAAFLGALFALLLWRLATAQGALALPSPWGERLAALSFDRRLSDFSKGVIDSANVVYFLVISIVFTALSAAALDWRRWR